MQEIRLSPRWTRRVAAAEIALMFMGSSLLTPLYGLYGEAFGFSQVTLTLVYASYVLGNLGALFLFGRLSDQIGRKRVSLLAIGAAGIATLLFLFARATAWLFVARAMSGLAIGLASGAATAWVAELIAGEDKQRASIVAASANFGGSAIGPYGRCGARRLVSGVGKSRKSTSSERNSRQTINGRKSSQAICWSAISAIPYR